MDFGSGSALLGGGDQALQEALARRGTGDAGVLNQQSPASAGGGQPMPQPLPGQAPQAMGQPQPAQSAPQPLPGESPATVDRNLILKALIGQIKAFDKHKEMGLG